jgi:hypothetical protein
MTKPHTSSTSGIDASSPDIKISFLATLEHACQCTHSPCAVAAWHPLSRYRIFSVLTDLSLIDAALLALVDGLSCLVDLFAALLDSKEHPEMALLDGLSRLVDVFLASEAVTLVEGCSDKGAINHTLHNVITALS